VVDVAGEHAPGEECLVLLRSVGGIGPNARGGVLLADQIGQSRPIMGIGGARIPGADQSMGPIDTDMVFIAEQLAIYLRGTHPVRTAAKGGSLPDLASYLPRKASMPS